MSRKIVMTDAVLLDPEAAEPLRGSLLIDVPTGRIQGRLGSDQAGPEDAARVSLGGRAVAPGFLDLHYHGELVLARGAAIHDALVRTAASFLRHGTTGFLATSVAWSPARMDEFLTQCASWTHEALSSTLLGVHLEGPWISGAAAGAQPRGEIRPFDAERDIPLLDREGLALVTLAPECAGAPELVRALEARGLVAAMGHTRADDAQIDACLGLGMTHATHLFNAMSGTRHRDPGVAARALADDQLTCDLICDGVHVHPHLVKLAARAKGEKLALITDRVLSSTAGDTGFGSGALRDDGRALWLEDGTLAGSSLSMDRALASFRDFTACSDLAAIRAATLVPARVLGIERERGTLRPGARADFAVLRAGTLDVVETWIGGRPVSAEAIE